MAAKAQPFIHPGILHTEESLQRMRKYIDKKTEPVLTAFQQLQADKRASENYKMAGPFEIIARDGTYRSTKGGSESDFSAAYYNALLFKLTGKEVHAAKAVEIINAYSQVMNGIDGHDAPLCCLQGFYLVNACELLRDRIDNAKVTKMLQRTFIPTIDRFEENSPYANGN